MDCNTGEIFAAFCSDGPMLPTRGADVLVLVQALRRLQRFAFKFAAALGPLVLLLVAQSTPAQTIVNLKDLNVELPGASKGKVSAYWLAPYVRVSSENIGKRNVITATWYGEDGEIKRSAEVNAAQPGFITSISRQIPASLAENRWAGRYLGQYEFRNVLEGVNEDWKVTLPQATGLSYYVTGSADSRILVHESRSTNGLITLDIYLHGKLVNTLGPYVQYGSEDVRMGEDGSLALLIWKDAGQTVPQIVVADSNGRISFRVDCGRDVRAESVAPDGAGALLRANLGEYPNKIQWYTSAGKTRSFESGPGTGCAGWIPGSHKSLFTGPMALTNAMGTAVVNYEQRYRLVDCDTGESVWDIPTPSGSHVLSVGLTGKYVLFAVAESYKPGPWAGAQSPLQGGQEVIRSFHAVDVADGKVAARWLAPYPRQLSLNRGQNFVRVAGKLYYVTEDEFAEIREEEITAKTNYWKAVEQGKP